MKIVIGLSGVKQSGKNTVGMIIREFIDAKEVALADKLKSASAKAFNIDMFSFLKQDLKEELFKNNVLLTKKRIISILKSFNLCPVLADEKPIKKLIGMKMESPRHILQIVGTELLRNAGNPDIHCENLELNEKENGITVITDIRFPNEHNYFSNLEDVKYIPLYVQRDKAEENIDDHPSEKSVMLFSDKCIKIDNNDSLHKTELQVRDIIEKEIFGNK